VPAAAVARLRKSLRSAARWWEDQSSVATVNPGTSTGDDRRVCSNRVLHGHLLGLAADLVAVTVARLAVDHRAASRSGTNDAGVGVDDVVEARGTGYKRTCYTAPGLLSCRRRANLDHHARRADPREHGRQAARSERDRPERASELYAESAASAPPRAALLNPIEPDSAIIVRHVWVLSSVKIRTSNVGASSQPGRSCATLRQPQCEYVR